MKKLSLAAALSAVLVMSTFTGQPARADGGLILAVVAVTAFVLLTKKHTAPSARAAKPRRAKKAK
jgi:hypothetical protein